MSPFPGIDPFVEDQRLWQDFHPSFLTALRDSLADRLPEPYVARIDERLSLVEFAGEERRETSLEIWHGADRRLVAVIELLSPTNKAGAGRRDYLAKRNALVRDEINLVEPDFLVSGKRLPMELPLPPGHYYALIARGERRPDCDVYAWTVRDPIPRIPIPLSAPDPEILVELGPIYGGVYERARYARSIDYQAPLALALAPEERAWAESLARTAGR